MSTSNAQQPDRPKRRRANKPDSPVRISPADLEKLSALAAANGTDPQAALHRLLSEATPQVDHRPALDVRFWTHATGRAALEDLRGRLYKPEADLSGIACEVLETVLGFPAWLDARLKEDWRYQRAEGVDLVDYKARRMTAALEARKESNAAD